MSATRSTPGITENWSARPHLLGVHRAQQRDHLALDPGVDEGRGSPRRATASTTPSTWLGRRVGAHDDDHGPTLPQKKTPAQPMPRVAPASRSRGRKTAVTRRRAASPSRPRSRNSSLLAVLLQPGEQQLGGLGGVERVEDAAQLPDPAQLVLAEQQLLVAGAGALDVNGREDAAVGQARGRAPAPCCRWP